MTAKKNKPDIAASQSSCNKIDLSIVIPSFGDRGHLADILQVLESQQPAVKEIIVSHSGTIRPQKYTPISTIPIHFLYHDQPLNSGSARNRGATIATGKFLAFIDDDVIPAKNWSDRLHHTLADDVRNTCFVGSIDCDVTGGYWGACLWFLEFGSVHSYMPSRSLQGGASANMFMFRELFVRSNGFPEQVTRCVDVEFMARCRQQGAKTYFQSTVIVGHRNISGYRHCITHAYSLGQGSARVRRLTKLKGDFFVHHPITIPLLIPIRLTLLMYRVVRWGKRKRSTLFFHLPGIALTTLAWTLGFAQCILETNKAN